MDKKYIIAVLAIIVILLALGISQYTGVFNQDSTFKVGEAVFSLPEGYSVVESTDNATNISNNFNTITIKCLDDKTVDQSVKKYVKFKERDNVSVNVTNRTVKGMEIQKSELENNTNNVHYWFKYHHKVYTMYTVDANKNIDKIILEIIRSIQPA